MMKPNELASHHSRERMRRIIALLGQNTMVVASFCWPRLGETPSSSTSSSPASFRMWRRSERHKKRHCGLLRPALEQGRVVHLPNEPTRGRPLPRRRF